MTTRGEFIEALRTYKGVPFNHLGRSKSGVDCYGLIYAALTDIGFKLDAPEAYNSNPDSERLTIAAHKYLHKMPYNRLQRIGNQLQPGDILSFWIKNPDKPKHLAVYTGQDSYGRDTVIHAYSRKQAGVIETPIALTFMSRRIHSAWSIPQLKD